MSKIKFCVWNIEWLNDLFQSNSVEFKANDTRVRGPNPGSSNNPTVLERRQSVSGVINELDLDVVVIVEGPNKADELQLFFDTDVDGDWQCDVQPSKGSSQIIGLAVRQDTQKFDSVSFERYHIGENQGGEGGALSEATTEFLMDTDGDGIKEQHKFERLPLYVQINAANGKRFRIVGVHLKSKGIFGSLEWARWWSEADANRKKIVAQCTQIRRHFLDHYLTDPSTQDIPLIVCGDINDGPGMDTSERRLDVSGVERLMGSVWKPGYALGNALFDALDDDDRWFEFTDNIHTTSFRDPLFGNYRKVWIDHVLYTRNAAPGWLSEAVSRYEFSDGAGGVAKIWQKYPHASDHYPVTATIDSDLL